MSLRYCSGNLLKIFLLLTIFTIQTAFAQTGTIRGTVYDETNKDELPGANIIVQGTSIGAATDLDGKFVLRNVPSGKQTIVVSYLGYVSKNVEVEIVQNRTLLK